MRIQTVVLERVPPQPWKNGGGSTRELLAWPAGGPWALRVSVATIERDGPFSPYPGVQRWFVLVRGEGVVLTLDGRRRLLERGSAPLPFDGAAAPHCQLVGDATEDLNFMVQASAGRGEMLAAEPGAEWVSRAGWRALYAADAATLQIDDTDVAAVRAGTLVWSDHGTRQRWRVLPAEPLAARAWWLAFEAAR